MTELNIENILNVLTEVKNIQSIFFDEVQLSVLKNINYFKEDKEAAKEDRKRILFRDFNLIQNRKNTLSQIKKEIDDGNTK